MTGIRHDPVRTWLYAAAALVLLIIAVGGITRLTESGLSIVRWKPVTGILPPLSAAEWQEEFAAYRQSPQFLQVNSDMDLAGFRRIYWWEYLHRLLGRLAGLAYFLPMVWFFLSGRLSRGMLPRLGGILLLGAIQGGVGWFMVASGLVDVPAVSPFRLALHLGLALALLGSLCWTAWERAPPPLVPPSVPPSPGTGRLLTFLFVLLCVQILQGALVAGNDAGRLYNTWPLTGTSFIPPGLWDPPLMENRVWLQWWHRQLGQLAGLLGVILFFLKRRSLGRLSWVMIALLTLQVLLGILVLVFHVPVSLAVLHQLNAALLFTGTLRAIFVTRGRTGDAGPRGPAPRPFPAGKTRR